MLHFFQATLPFSEPVLIFSLVLSIILISHLFLKKIRIPGIIGIIIAGIIVGPNGFNLLARDSSIILFGTVGILYIMFLAGLEIDLNDFKKNRNKGLVFGLLTFSIPMLLGIFSGLYLLHFSLVSSILLASMFASHTLLAYPIASRLGISKNEAVAVTVAGTIITDIAALLVLAIIAAMSKGELNQGFWIKIILAFTFLGIFIAFIIPRIAKLFFRKIGNDGGLQFIFVLAVVFASAFFANIAGVEGLIGAFLAGLSLNRLIPKTSPLMNRLEFVGNTLFIPFFLLSVGMLVDIKVFFAGPESLFVALTMTIIAITGKWLAAYSTQKLFKYKKVERSIMFGLSNAQAAATLAAVLVGYRLQLFDEHVLNGTIMMILVTCFISSFIVEQAGKKLAIQEGEKIQKGSSEIERILVPIAHQSSIDPLIDLALMVKNQKSKEPIFPLSIIKDDEEAKEKVLLTRKSLEKIVQHASATENNVQIISRIDSDIAGGIARTIKEFSISKIIIGWNGTPSTSDSILGSVLDNLLSKTDQMILVSKLVVPLNTAKKIIIVTQSNAEFEAGFTKWIKSVRLLSKQTGSHILFIGALSTIDKLKTINRNLKPNFEASYKTIQDSETIESFARFIHPDDIVIFVSARKGTLSYKSHLDQIPKIAIQLFEKNNLIIIFPEQNTQFLENSTLQLRELPSAPLPQDILRINKLSRRIRMIIRKKKKFNK